MSEPERPPSDPVSVIVLQMRSHLSLAMKSRDRLTVSTLRTALAAIANAEAPPAEPVSTAVEPVVGRLVEHRRLELSIDDVQRILRDEIADRHDTIAAIEPHGRDDEVDDLRSEISVLEVYLD